MKKVILILSLCFSCCKNGESKVNLVRSGIHEFERSGDIEALRKLMINTKKCDACYRLEAYALLYQSISKESQVYKSAWDKGDVSLRSFILDLKLQSRGAYETFYTTPVPEVDWGFTDKVEGTDQPY